MEAENPESRFIAQKCTNLKSDVIEITEDKLRLILSKYIMRLKKNRDWIGYGGMTLTVVLSLVTCDFNKNFLGIEANIWYAIFVLSAFVLGILTIVAIFNALTNRKCEERMIQEIKNKN